MSGTTKTNLQEMLVFKNILKMGDFFKKEDPRVSFNAFMTFAAVCLLLRKKDGEALTVGEVGDCLNISKAAGSRNLRYLSDLGSKDSKRAEEHGGASLVKLITDPSNLSKKTVELTTKGKQLEKRLLKLFE